jgi:hypothetical protein
MELQSREMAKIQAAITEQLREVAGRQANLEALNDKLRERAETARQRLQAHQFQLTEARLQELTAIRYIICHLRLKGMVHEIFFSFFHQITSPGPKRHVRKRFRIFSNIRGVIHI